MLLLHADDVLRLLIPYVALMHVGRLNGDTLHARILLRNVVTRLCRHVEDRRRLGRITDNVVVDVVVIDDVRHVATLRGHCLLVYAIVGGLRCSLATGAGANATAPLTVQVTVVLTVLGHRVLC